MESQIFSFKLPLHYTVYTFFLLRSVYFSRAAWFTHTYSFFSFFGWDQNTLVLVHGTHTHTHTHIYIYIGAESGIFVQGATLQHQYIYQNNHTHTYLYFIQTPLYLISYIYTYTCPKKKKSLVFSIKFIFGGNFS